MRETARNNLFSREFEKSSEKATILAARLASGEKSLNPDFPFLVQDLVAQNHYYAKRYKKAAETLKKDSNTIKQLAQAQNGYISDQRFEDNLYNKSSRFTIKVPKSTFDGLLDSISKVAEFIEYENITTQDVTEEYIDLETRLKTKMEVKARYEEVLRKNAKTVEDILATEDKLRIIQEEIESAQGRLKYLSSRVAYSSIQVDLYESVEYKEEPKSYTKSFMTKITDGLKFGWEMIEGFILILVHIWPILIVGGLLFLFVRKRLKK